jgi:hypothetical protein
MSTSSTHWRAAAAAAAADAEVREARIAAVEVVVQQAAETTRVAIAMAEAAVAAVVALREEDVDDQDGARPRGPHGYRNVSPSPVRRRGHHHQHGRSGDGGLQGPDEGDRPDERPRPPLFLPRH